MYGFYYIYKGPKHSVFNFYIGSFFITESIDSKYEKSVPNKGHIYKPESLNWIDTKSLPTTYMNLKTFDSDLLNIYGDTLLKKGKKTLLNSYMSSLKFSRKNLFVKDVVSPTTWPERMAVINAVVERNIVINRVEIVEEVSISKVETSKESQINYLYDLRVLPPYVNWYKAVELFTNVYPKPIWYKKELEDYRRLCNE